MNFYTMSTIFTQPTCSLFLWLDVSNFSPDFSAVSAQGWEGARPSRDEGWLLSWGDRQLTKSNSCYQKMRLMEDRVSFSKFQVQRAEQTRGEGLLQKPREFLRLKETATVSPYQISKLISQCVIVRSQYQGERNSQLPQSTQTETGNTEFPERIFKTTTTKALSLFSFPGQS